MLLLEEIFATLGFSTGNSTKIFTRYFPYDGIISLFQILSLNFLCLSHSSPTYGQFHTKYCRQLFSLAFVNSLILCLLSYPCRHRA